MAQLLNILKKITLGAGATAAIAFTIGLGIFFATGKANIGSAENFGSEKGCFGEIKAIGEDFVVIEEQNSKEETVLLGKNTIVKFEKENLNLPDLKIGDNITVVGKINTGGQMDAKFIRVVSRGNE